MSQPRQDPAPIIAASLNYWSGWVEGLNHSPTPAFVQKHELILHAVKMGLGLTATRRAAVDLTLATFVAAYGSGGWADWRPIYEQINAAWNGPDDALRVRVLSRLGQCYCLSDQLERATAVHHEAETLAAQLPPDNLLACEIAFQLTEDYRRRAKYERAKEYALAAWRLVENDETQPVWRATIANSLGLIDWATGAFVEADKWLTMAADCWRPLSRPVELGRTLSNLGVALEGRQKFDEALVVYRQAFTHLDGTAAWIDKLKVQYNIGVILFNKEEYEQAENIFREANAAIAQRLASGVMFRAYISHSLGNAISKQGRFSEAEPFLRQAINAWDVLGDKLNQGNSWAALAEALTGQAQTEAACAASRQALILLEAQRHIPRGERLYQEQLQAYQTLGCLDE